MSLHNVLALKASRSLIHLVNTAAPWRQVFRSSAVSLGYARSGITWPVPDAVIVDGPKKTASFCALEFKPPDSSKSECVRGLGQVTTYLCDYDCAALILPDRADDGYEIGKYIAGLLSSKSIAQKRIGVYTYPVATSVSGSATMMDMQLIKPIGQLSQGLSAKRKVKLERTFWSFWRDASLHEIFIVLDTADRLAGQTDIRGRSLDEAFRAYAGLTTRDPQGNTRENAGIGKSHFKGNTSITLTHLRLWEEDGTLTGSGRTLVHCGRTFGPDSAPFRDAFAHQALSVGRHYELIKLVYEFQRTHSGRYKSADDFASALEGSLESEGLLRRLPNRRTTGGRRFFKAELTFWGLMLGIIEKHGQSYIVPDVGLDFDWPRIVDLMRGDLPA